MTATQAQVPRLPGGQPAAGKPSARRSIPDPQTSPSQTGHSQTSPSHAPVSAPAEHDTGSRRMVSLAALVGVVFTVLAFWYGTGPLHDNSFMTHLATGRLILAGHFPHTDPYSFTAHGSPWVVQSWIPAVGYAAADKLGGAAAIRAMSGAITALLMALVWRLTRPAKTLVPRVLIAALTFTVGAGLWSTRPLMFGLVLLAVTLLIVQERRRPYWLVPLFWLWVNSHGSWPLGLVLLGVLVIGRRADHEPTDVPLRALAWALLGTVLGAIGPLGLKALTFPVELLGRQQVLRSVAEWQSPDFADIAQRAFLVAVVVAVVCLARRPKYTNGLLIAVFTAAALLGSRNIVVASVVLVPVLAAGLGGLGSLSGDRRSRPITVAALAVIALGLVAGAVRLQGPSWSLDAYPQRATSYLQRQGLLDGHHRVIARDLVGNYWELRFGTHANVFFDDRFDMYSDKVNDDVQRLMDARPGWKRVVDQWHPDAILWQRDQPLAQVLRASPAWRVTYQDKHWVVFAPVPSSS